MKACLNVASEDVVRPFFALIIVYCKSALSHIREEIRIDGLQFVSGVLLSFFPQMTVEYGSDRLIPDLLGLLCADGKLVHSGSSSAGSRKDGLAVNPSSQLGSSKARMEVLKCLYDFVKLGTSTASSSWAELNAQPASREIRPSFFKWQEDHVVQLCLSAHRHTPTSRCQPQSVLTNCRLVAEQLEPRGLEFEARH
jgi:hypothetical protein